MFIAQSCNLFLSCSFLCFKFGKLLCQNICFFFKMFLAFACIGMTTWQSIVSPIAIIGLVSFVFSIAGCLIGVSLGKRINLRAELWAGIILIGIGAKILFEHLA